MHKLLTLFALVGLTTTTAARAALHITGFTRLDLDDYVAILPLGRHG